MDYIRPKYSKSSLRTHTSSKQRQSFLLILSFRSATQVFHYFFSNVRLAFSYAQVLLVPVKNGDELPTHNCRRSGEAQMDLRSGFAQHWQVSRYTTCMTKSFLTCCLSMIRKKSDVYVYAPISQTVYKGAQIPRFFWEWTCMHKQSIPGHSLSSHAAWEQGYH